MLTADQSKVDKDDVSELENCLKTKASIQEIDKVVHTDEKNNFKSNLNNKKDFQKLIYNSICALSDPVSLETMLKHLDVLDTSSWIEVVEERFLGRLCGYPVCTNKLNLDFTKNFVIDKKRNKIYDTFHEINKFCSNDCLCLSKSIQHQLYDSPLWITSRKPKKYEISKDYTKFLPEYAKKSSSNVEVLKLPENNPVLVKRIIEPKIVEHYSFEAFNTNNNKKKTTTEVKKKTEKQVEKKMENEVKKNANNQVEKKTESQVEKKIEEEKPLCLHDQEALFNDTLESNENKKTKKKSTRILTEEELAVKPRCLPEEDYKQFLDLIDVIMISDAEDHSDEKECDDEEQSDWDIMNSSNSIQTYSDDSNIDNMDVEETLEEKFTDKNKEDKNLNVTNKNKLKNKKKVHFSENLCNYNLEYDPNTLHTNKSDCVKAKQEEKEQMDYDANLKSILRNKHEISPINVPYLKKMERKSEIKKIFPMSEKVLSKNIVERTITNDSPKKNKTNNCQNKNSNKKMSKFKQTRRK